MDEPKFWEIIGACKGSGGDTAYSGRLTRILQKMSPSEIREFYLHYMHTRARANTPEFWAASVLLNSGPTSDDGFEYFRNWLISRGQQVYLEAMQNPDLLANVDIPLARDGPEAQFEKFASVAAEAYMEKTGHSLFDDFSSQGILLDGEDQPFDWQLLSRDDVLAKSLPHLWAKYGESKIASDQIRADIARNLSADELDIPGLGIVKVGGILVSRWHGKGVVKNLCPLDNSAVVAFRDCEIPIVIDPVNCWLVKED